MNGPQLGLQSNEVRFVDHDPLWADEFSRIKDLLLKVTTELQPVQIQHIGSTAIVEIQAKPIIDIALGVEWVEELLQQYEEQLKQIGFYRLRVQRPQEIVFAKFSDDQYQIKTHFIHMLPLESDHWLDMLFFRDYMNEHKGARQQYERLKLEFIAQEQGGITEYTKHKEQFVQQIFALRNQQ